MQLWKFQSFVIVENTELYLNKIKKVPRVAQTKLI